MIKIKIILSYCLPALFALILILYNYYDRTHQVADTILLHQQQIENNPSANSLHNEPLSGEQSATIKQLLRYLEVRDLETDKRLSKVQLANEFRDSIDKNLTSVWKGNALFIFSLVILPYILFGSRLAFSNEIKLTADQRLKTTTSNWWMKFVTASVMSIGWLYVLNPTGRGESTMVQYLIKVDLSQANSLPIYINSEGMVPVVAGFLGWYLYLLTYFFSKLVHHDVVSTRVYGLMFKKFLLTYGIALIIPSVDIASAASGMVQQGTSQSMLMFLVGYFPMGAFSLLKEKGVKMASDVKAETGYLSELPGISRWQVLRLEEEGIDNMAALASASQDSLHEDLHSMSTMIYFWIDISQLYVTVGRESYQKLLPRCKSASGFINKINDKDDDFIAYVKDQGVGCADEICNLIERTFDTKLIAYSR
jgi:hypothetical protein